MKNQLPALFFEPNGKLRLSVKELFQLGLGYKRSPLDQTIWKVLPQKWEFPFSAITLGPFVCCSYHAFKYDLPSWLELIAHEEWHRQEVGDEVLAGSMWYLEYIYEYLITSKRSYWNMAHEKRAYTYGMDNNSYAYQLIHYQNDLILNLFTNEKITDADRLHILKPVAIQFFNQVMKNKIKT